EAARGAERQAEELQLVGGGPRAFVEQFEAARAHLGIMLVGEQFEPVVERAHRAQQVVAQPRTEQARENGRTDGQGLAPLPRASLWRSGGRPARHEPPRVRSLRCPHVVFQQKLTSCSCRSPRVRAKESASKQGGDGT